MTKHSLFRVPRIRSILPLTSVALFVSSWVPTASARLFLDPDSGNSQVLISTETTPPLSVDRDDMHVEGSRPVFLSYFGTLTFGLPTISVNGNVFLSPYTDEDDYAIQAIGSSFQNQISPFWQDHGLGTNGRIIETSTSDYYSITWENMEVSDYWHGVTYTGIDTSFQVIIFEEDTLLNGSSFLAGDIIFSYDIGAVYPSMNEFNIGLESAAGDAAFGPDSGLAHMNGTYYPGVFGPFQVGEDQYMLFRANSESNYDSSIETMAIPEPSTLAALLSGSLLVGRRVFRRRLG